MTCSEAPYGIPYSSPASWPSQADREHYRAEARRAYPHAAADKIEDLARLSAYMDARLPVSRFNKGLVKLQMAVAA